VVWAAVRGLAVVPVGEEAGWASGLGRAEARAPALVRVAAGGQGWVLDRGQAVGWVVWVLVRGRGSVAASGWADLVPDPGREARAAGSAVRAPGRGAAAPAPAAAAGSAPVQEARTTWAWVAG
jgi:hypothetical protein